MATFNLFNEKPARLEGALVENIFIRDMLGPSFKNISSGWWFTTKQDSDENVAIKLSMKPEALSGTDFTVAEKLTSKTLISDVIFVCPFQDGFGWVSYKRLDQKDVKESWSREVRNLPKKEESKVEEKSPLDSSRIKAALDALEKNGFLEEVRIERLFASNYLNHFSWDMDAYVVIQGEVIGFEVKQKYPTYQGKFGINVGLLRLFQDHADIGIPVWHIILTKPVRHKDFSAVELISNSKFADISLWIGTRINPGSIEKSDIRTSAEYTSLYKTNRLRFHEIPCSEFFLIKKFTDIQNQLCMQTLLKGECQRLGSEKDIPIAR